MDPVNTSNPYGPSAGDILAGNTLTGESLLLYISTRIEDLDSDVNGLLGQQERALDQKEYINEVRDWAEEVLSARESGNYDRLDELLQFSFPRPPNSAPDLGPELLNLYNTHCYPDLNKDTMDTFLNGVGRVYDEINGQSEISMIRLQQVMGQRQVSVQLSTNLLGKLDAGLEAIVGNLR